ncbi:uncharacterized protein A1O9_00957 [Exophiala aquamarina CBS 119918]|uniref:DNA (cytosine-5-)-methyltransferase n=1 Tax=Exophiala aquamarina CBS 119918 TaxID=1182545 RepID=A0A072PT99_9EURO|nr:uncharacterized protein A1O9_00957 [Exophiala aquamarina CBS 119918]KEF62982.1 hypothetical protein A1O9_00957 [Exophiala aquamarina CBS 119918]
MVLPLRYEISSSSDHNTDGRVSQRPPLRRCRPPVVEVLSESEDEDYEYLSFAEDDENGSCGSLSCPSSSEEELDSTESDLADESAGRHDGDSDAEEDLAVWQESDGINFSEEDGPFPCVDQSLEGELAELRRQLLKLESAEALRVYYPPVLSGNSIPAPLIVEEAAALEELTALDPECDGGSDDYFFELDLYDFCVYRSPRHPNGSQGQYESLHIVTTNPKIGHWVVEGALRSQNQQRRIRGFIDRVSIGNYENICTHTTSGAVWIKTELSSKQRYWYRLKEPAGGYRMLWHDFLWLADFTKYFIDYLHESSKKKLVVSLLDFKSNFWTQLKEWHGDSLQSWRKQREESPRKPLDFRKDVLWYRQFLNHQVDSLCQDDANHERFQQPVWNEIGVVPSSYDQGAEAKDENTVVTPNVAACFHEKFPHWQDEHKLLDMVYICPEVEKFRRGRRQHWGLPDKFSVDQTPYFVICNGSGSSMANTKISLVDHLLEQASAKNDPVQLRASELLEKIVIVRMYSDKRAEYLFYYAWVREVVTQTKLAVVWLFRSSETLCGTGFYPIGNELFFSSECNCEPVLASDVVDVISASAFSDRATNGAVLFVHSLFDEDQQIHLTADMNKLICRCQQRFHVSPKKIPQPAPTQRQGVPQLSTTELYSGAGFLGHSMAATGYIKPVVAIECCETAALTYKANDELDVTKVITASVNTCLLKIMTGEEPIRPTECIIAGCPCQGFSLLNSNKLTRKSQKNCSLLAHTLTWFEVFLPAYGLIENVPNMDSLDPNPCEQAICYLVALGYQVRKIFPVDSTLGGASSRKRLIIMVAAPNAILPAGLNQTHGDGHGQMKTRTCEEVISDLEPLANDTVLNVSNPDHIPLHRFKIDFKNNVNLRDVVERIPTKPVNLGVAQAYRLGRLSPSQRAWFCTLSKEKQSKSSKSLRRINRYKPFRTVCTVISPLDARHGGEMLHYEQNRANSILEARRAMGVPDCFIMMGSIIEQYKLLGNGVPWALGAALGRSVGKAWVGTINKRPWLSNTAPDVSTRPANNSVSWIAPKNVHPHGSAPMLPNRSSPGVKEEIDLEDRGKMVQTIKKRARYVLSDDYDDGDNDDNDPDIEVLCERPVPKRVR